MKKGVFKKIYETENELNQDLSNTFKIQTFNNKTEQ